MINPETDPVLITGAAGTIGRRCGSACATVGVIFA